MVTLFETTPWCESDAEGGVTEESIENDDACKEQAEPGRKETLA
jgi:hypothetical protein